MEHTEDYVKLENVSKIYVICTALSPVPERFTSP